jgi:nicotinamidase-related amidase
MPLSTVDPKPALVLIDLQKGLRGIPGAPYSMDEVIKRAAGLAAAFRSYQLPVVLVSVNGQPPGRTDTRPSGGAHSLPEGFAELVDELDVQPSDIRVTKKSWGAFQATPLDGLLRDLGVTQVIVGGVATSAGVEATARSAYEYGYNVVLATDAMTDTDAAMHDNSVERIFPKLGETATTSEIVELLQSRENNL